MTSKHSASDVASWLLHGAKDLVWQDDPLQRKAVASAAPPATSVSVAPKGEPLSDRTQATGAAQTACMVSDVAAHAMSAELLALVMNRPTAYSALTEATTALVDIALDDTTRTRAAFAVLKKTQQRSVDQIVQAIDIHLGLLDAERNRFASQSRQAENGGVTARAQQAASLQKSAQAIGERMTKLRADTDAQLLQLAQEQAQQQTEADALTRQIEVEKTRIERTTQEFDNAAACVEKWLHSERSTIRQRLASEG